MRRPARFLPVLAAVLSVSLAAPAAADAHALFGDYDPDRPLWKYLTLGFGHMVTGWDHLLFAAGVVLLAGAWGRAAKLISLFVAGHSLTLIVATLAGWRIDATAVDVVIALSLVVLGVVGFRGRPERLQVFGAVVFGFGLIHGLGLSTRLQDLGLPEDGVLVRVILFNVGVELGQLTALTVLVGAGALLARGLPDRARVLRPAFGGIAVAGLVAAAIMSFPSEEAATVAEEADEGTRIGACVERESQPPDFTVGAAHPEKTFYGPEEEAPADDLAHVVGDGFVVVHYRADLPRPAVRELRAFVEQSQSQYVLGAADPAQTEPVRAVAALRTLTCDEPDVDALTTFRDNWFAYLQAQRGIAPSG